MELSSSNIKKFLIFSQQKSFLIFQETETLKNLLYFRNNFPSPKNEKNPVIFRKWNFLVFLVPRLKNFRRNFQSPKIKQKSALKKFLVSCDVVICTVVKDKDKAISL